MGAVPQAYARKSGLLCEIVLTGGPAGGKSASLEFIRASLASRGYRVLICPEAATMLYSNGVGDVGRIASEKRDLYRETQKTIALMQRVLREQLRRYAEQFDEPVIIIYDRGEMDCAAYLSPSEWQKNLEEMGVTEKEILRSYDAVIHLRSAAGTPWADLSNNPSRREADPTEALSACDRTMEAWKKHPHRYVIDAHDSFDVKLSQVFAAIAETIARKAK